MAQDAVRFTKINEGMQKIANQASKLKQLSLSGDSFRDGIRLSNLVLNSKLEINLTPYTKNMLEELDRVNHLEVGAKPSKMEAYITDETRKLLWKYVGKRQTDYNTNLDPDDFNNYVVDCGRNFKPYDEVRHIVPGMNAKREENFKKFYKPLTDIELDGNSPAFKSALSLLGEGIPSVTSAADGRTVNLPFMSKHTNVGYPYFRNDKAKVPGKTNLTYGQLVDNEARKLKPKDVANYPFVALGRNQRGKARPILAGSRLQALVYNQLESQEIDAYRQRSPLFIGYNDPNIFKDKMIRLAKGLSSNKNYTCYNRDYTQFDTTVNPVLRRLIGAIRIEKAVDAKAKDIAFGRTVSTQKSQLINGGTKKLTSIFGRVFSGEIDTNAGGGLVNGLAGLSTIIKMDSSIVKTYRGIVSYGTSPLWVMGDDCMMVQPRDLDNKEFSRLVKTDYGLDVSDTKGEYGLFFLQKRLFKNNHIVKGGAEYILITPFTRVIRSLTNKESRKGLGPAGGTLATYMLLYQLIEGPELMLDVARIFYPFDKHKLGTDGTLSQFKKLLAQESKEAMEKGNTVKDTLTILDDGDPQKKHFFKGDSIDDTFVGRVHSILKQLKD